MLQAVLAEMVLQAEQVELGRQELLDTLVEQAELVLVVLVEMERKVELAELVALVV